jgi:hypothetical protein
MTIPTPTLMCRDSLPAVAAKNDLGCALLLAFVSRQFVLKGCSFPKL